MPKKLQTTKRLYDIQINIYFFIRENKNRDLKRNQKSFKINKFQFFDFKIPVFIAHLLITRKNWILKQMEVLENEKIIFYLFTVCFNRT